MSYKIEDSVEMPKTTYKSRSGLATAIRSLEVGQSFLSSDEDTRNKISSAMTYVSLKTGRKFISRSDSGKFRIWRIE